MIAHLLDLAAVAWLRRRGFIQIDEPGRCEMMVDHPDGGVADCPNMATRQVGDMWLCSDHA